MIMKFMVMFVRPHIFVRVCLGKLILIISFEIDVELFIEFFVFLFFK